MKAIISIFLALCVVLCAAIGGGKDAELGQFPYQASIRTERNNGPICSASILNSRFLLTLASCLWFDDPDSLIAVVGVLHKEEDGLLFYFDNVMPHEEFDYTSMVNDIALIRTDEEIIFTDFIQPIALPTRNLPEEGNVATIVSGWGRVLKASTDILQYAIVPTISNGECKRSPAIGNYVDEKKVCTLYGKGVGACLGDSGKI